MLAQNGKERRLTPGEAFTLALAANMATVSFVAGCWRIDRGLRGIGTWAMIAFPIAAALLGAAAALE